MKTILISTAALSLILGLSAAQAQDQGGGNRRPAAERQIREEKPAKATTRARIDRTSVRIDRSTMTRSRTQPVVINRRTIRTTTPTTSRGVWKAPAGRTASPTINRAPTNNAMTGRAGTRNVDVSRFRGNVTSSRHFHAGSYRGPSGYHYRHWSYGDRLPSMYFVRDYWLLDFLTYGLFEPPYGYRWVRYGPDALLIDMETGEIVRVEYGVFY